MPSENNVTTLKYILQNCLHPEVLDAHPWAKSLIVQENAAELKGKTPGQQLVITIANFFVETMPKIPPQQDADWEGFASLAAQYFAPLLFGSPVPTSSREAYNRMEESILLFVFGEQNGETSATQKAAYKLQGKSKRDAEAVFDKWLEKGLQLLAEKISRQEQFLSKLNGMPAIIPSEKAKGALRRPASKTQKKKISREVWISAITGILILLALIGFGFLKAQKVIRMAGVVRQDAAYLQSLLTESDIRAGKTEDIGSAISTLQRDFSALKQETQAYFWMGPMLRWVPVHGGNLASIDDLAALADSLLNCADQSYRVISPLVDGEFKNTSPAELTKFLKNNQLQLARAQQYLKDAEAARSRLQPETLSPEVRDLILNNIDPAIQVMKDGLTIATKLPVIMGAGSAGPQTYLLLAQNEDELRPTGGFITAAGLITFQDGSIGEVNFVNTGLLDNWQKVYPAAPWQLKEYMNSPVLVLRDSNWHTHYPTTAAYARNLYSFANDRSVDGVIAFDQHLLVEILKVTGPVEVEGRSYPIDAENVIQYMRESKTPNAQEVKSQDWDDKAFLNKLTSALLKKMLNGEVKWEFISAMLRRMLDEHHILLQVDDPEINALLARYHWDGAVLPGAGDFLMVIDSNIGFNKTNAVVESSLIYDVDLTDMASPIGSLTVFHTNTIPQKIVCKQWLKNRAEGEKDYPITDCYWNYLRIYKPAGTALISATPQVVPDIWMINKQTNPGQVDILDEDIEGAQAFGTLQVVPTGESLSIDFQFALPSNVLQIEGERATYTLRVQKQPGTLAVPITLRAHLPRGAKVISMPATVTLQENNLVYETDLKTDFEFSIVFSVP